MSENNEPQVNTSATPEGASQGVANQAKNDANDATNAQRGVKRPRTDSMNAEAPDTGANVPKSYVEQEKVQLIVEDKKFLVHAHKIKEFAKFKIMLEEAPEEADLRVLELPEVAASVERLLELLYAPIYSTETFHIDTLVTTLIFATKYEHPNLRQYAIRIIESRQSEIPPMKRIQLSRAYDLTKWQPAALDELAAREQLITLEEANELGAELFRNLSTRREKERYSRGLADARTGKRR
ncbi:hypothetical protein FRC12_009146 [Ceratobasidium sp. 428]|nr:hypothetical protein FRC12_009146 [Ceratobasidium sp. 428]